MRMRMEQFTVYVLMSVSLMRQEQFVMVVLVVLIMDMAVNVLVALVPVLVTMRFGQVKPDANTHKQGACCKIGAYPLPKNKT